MTCSQSNIPRYLHSDNKVKLPSSKFRSYHKIFRLQPKNKNPLIEPAWINALSCNWSKLIKTKHVKIVNSEVGTNYYFNFALMLMNYRLEKFDSNSNEFKGKHILSCRFEHTPRECDYSHIEVFINHKIYNNTGKEPYFNETYSHQDWAEKRALLKRGKSKFFKELKSQYRLDMIKIFSLEEKDTQWDKQIYHFLSQWSF